MAKTSHPNTALTRGFILFLQLLSPVTGEADFQVLAPGSPLRAEAGGDAELLCRLSPAVSLAGMEVRWFRERPAPAVHVSRTGVDEPAEQMAEYRGRTRLASGGPGTAALTIRNVTPRDGGRYHCLFAAGAASASASVWLDVAAPLSRSLFTEWRLALLLSLIALGLVMAGVICLFGKRKRQVHRAPLEEETQQEEQRQQASRAEAEPFRVSPSLDPETASPKLMVSEDQKSVQRLLFNQDLPPNSMRFDQDPCVLAQERFWAGKYYWEVEVGERKAWILGVCLESIGREGRIPKSPEHGLWAIEFYKKRFWALSYPRTCLFPSQPFRRMGIFLDWDAGEISFYNVTDGSLVYTFYGLSFPGPLRPFLCLWTHDPRPLTICPAIGEMYEDTSSSQRLLASPRTTMELS